MADPFKTLPAKYQKRLKIPPGFKDWMRCASCNILRNAASLKKCGGCSNYRLQPIFYCDSRCQRAAWPKHKEDCKIFQEYGKDESRNTQAKLQRRLGNWSSSNSQIVNWVAVHAYHCNPHMDQTKVILDFEIDFPSFQIVSFCFIPKDDPSCLALITDPSFQNVHGGSNYWYRLSLNPGTPEAPDPHYICGRLAMSLAHIHDDPGAPFPEWPWIAAQLTREEETSRLVTRRKWDLLVTAVHQHRLKYPNSLKRFVASKMQLGVPLIVSDLEAWYEKASRKEIWDEMIQSGYVERILNRT